jgi:hypothetical protein
MDDCRWSGHESCDAVRALLSRSRRFRWDPNQQRRTADGNCSQRAAYVERVCLQLDGQELADLMIQHGVGVRSYRTVEFKRLDEDFFDEE